MARAKQARREEALPEDDQDMDELPEGNFVVLTGYERMVNSYVNHGNPFHRGEVLNVTHAMYHRLMGLTFLHPKSDEERPVFRDATAEEIKSWVGERSGDTPETMREEDLIREARKESVAAGHANPDTEERELREEHIAAQRDPIAAPARRRRRSTRT